MWQRIKMGMYRFMQGRYGFDSLANFLLMQACILIIFNIILSFTPFRNGYLSLFISMMSWIILIYCYVRVFSKNYAKRKAQNDKFEQKTAKLRERHRKSQAMSRIKKTHHIFCCPGCRQKIKIPKGKGKVLITCPKCRMEFTKKT